MKNLKPILIIAVAFLILPLAALAHNPRLVPESAGIYKIENPEISQAFYGELKGEPQLFSLSSEKPFNFYLNILSPAIANARQDFSVEVYQGEELVAALDGTRHEWTKFYEPFGGDDYWKGPETEFEAKAGDYSIKVYNSFSDLCTPKKGETDKSNLIDPKCMAFYGRYSLAIGKIESFPPGEILKTLIALPALKKDFFNKSPFTAYFNYVGLMMLVMLAVLFIVGWLAIKGMRFLRK